MKYRLIHAVCYMQGHVVQSYKAHITPGHRRCRVLVIFVTIHAVSCYCRLRSHLNQIPSSLISATVFKSLLRIRLSILATTLCHSAGQLASRRVKYAQSLPPNHAVLNGCPTFVRLRISSRSLTAGSLYHHLPPGPLSSITLRLSSARG